MYAEPQPNQVPSNPMPATPIPAQPIPHHQPIQHQQPHRPQPTPHVIPKARPFKTPSPYVKPNGWSDWGYPSHYNHGNFIIHHNKTNGILLETI